MTIIILAMAVIVFVGFTRTVSFAVWNLKNKNYAGAAALGVLAVFFTVMAILTYLS